jgi:hypothetical protein
VFKIIKLVLEYLHHTTKQNWLDGPELYQSTHSTQQHEPPLPTLLITVLPTLQNFMGPVGSGMNDTYKISHWYSIS